MFRFVLKTVLSALIIAGVSEAGKKSATLASIFAALPLTTLMTVMWLYSDTGDVHKVADLSMGIFWAIIPSFLFICGLPLLLRQGVPFGWSMLISVGSMLVGYAGYVRILGKLGIRF